MARPERLLRPARAPMPHRIRAAPNLPRQGPERSWRGSTCHPSGVWNSSASPSNPCQRQRVRSSAPALASRRNQARSSGEAFIAVGKTRPDVPVNTSCPRPRAHAWASAGPKAASIGASQPDPYFRMNNSRGSSFVRFSPDLPAIRNFRAGVGLASAITTLRPAKARTSAAISPAGPAPMTRASLIAARRLSVGQPGGDRGFRCPHPSVRSRPRRAHGWRICCGRHQCR